MRDALRAEDLRHAEILAKADIPIPGSQDQFHLPVTVEEPRIVEIWDKVRGAIEIAKLIEVAVEERLHIERPRHGDAVCHHVGMLESEVHGMIRAKAAARHTQRGSRIELANQRQHFVENIVLELNVASHTVMREQAFLLP